MKIVLEKSIIEQIIELSKLNKTMVEISQKLSLTYKEVSDVLIDNNLQSLIGLKSKISRKLKKIEDKKTLEERNKISEDINPLINQMYDNFKWVVDNMTSKCKGFYEDASLGETIESVKDLEIENFIQSIKKSENFIDIQIKTNLTPNQIIQYITHYNKGKKSTITKRLSKIQSEVKGSERTLIKLEIEKVVDELYIVCKWLSNEYEFCVEIFKTYRQLKNDGVKINIHKKSKNTKTKISEIV
jgi:hypothetical protein